jgi:hypothetical protein
MSKRLSIVLNKKISGPSFDELKQAPIFMMNNSLNSFMSYAITFVMFLLVWGPDNVGLWL